MQPDNTDPYQQNPLFSLPPKKEKVVEPISLPESAESSSVATESNPAADVIRQKINTLYSSEPSAREEIAEASAIKSRSKHQQFMYELNNSGKSLAEIQTAWHEYYVGLPNHEKHEVWQEFYANHSKIHYQPRAQTAPVQPEQSAPRPERVHQPILRPQGSNDARDVGDIRTQILKRIQTRSNKKSSSHLQSLTFGLSMGAVTMLIFLFGFFNERFIAPFITPSKSVSSTPIIIDPVATAVGPEPKIIIPKINVEIPVVYDEPSIDEAAVQRALEHGVLHYATTPNPGELGNGVIFGHSSNNILNRGKYKFAFVSLNKLEIGDTFMLHKDGKRYVYKIYEKKIVKPTEVSVLGPASRPATMTLITCDPPGTALNRLVVIAEQITPDPSANVPSSVKSSDKPNHIPSEAPSLWSRMQSWFSE